MDIRTKVLTHEDVLAIIAKVSAAGYDGNVKAHDDAHAYRHGMGYAGRIDVSDSRGPGARRSWSGRRMPAACWHAFRDVFAAVVDADPAAVIVTAIARYDGRDSFEATYPDTAHHNVGSMAAPAYMPDLCDC